MYLTIVALPFLGAMASGVLGRSLGVTGAAIVSTSSITISAILTIVAFYEVSLSGSPVSIYASSWTDSGAELIVSWSFLFDDLTVSILLAVLIVSSLVHLYSISYIETDCHVQRFISYLSLFTAFIVLLVTGDSLLVIFVGWEGIGIASYLLISFWLTRVQANKAAVQAITVNRVGDAILTVGFFTILWVFSALDYSTVISVSPLINESVLTIIGLILFGGAISKSAQVPLHGWLPSAMEGPTPVSALIHAATLVTAGVYVILRCSPLLEYAPTSLLVITWIGALTAFFAASTGLMQNDLKRVIAYSTCSQLGYMIFSVGLSSYNVALFHLVAHAFFKALLFLGAGAVIHGLADQQDLRRLGGLVSYIPFTYTAILIGSLSLIALPWLTGFYSKDVILELAAGRYTISGIVAYIIGTISAGLTAFYSIRLASLTFFTTPSAQQSDYEHAHEAPIIIVIPLVILSILALVFGYVASDLFRGLGSDFLGSALFINPSHITLVEAEFALPLYVKLLPAIISIGGGIAAIVLYHGYPHFIANLTNANSFGLLVYKYLNGKWFIDSVVTNLFILPALTIGLIVVKVVDHGVIEYTGPNGLSNVIPSVGREVANYDTGVTTSYALYFVLFMLCLIFFVLGGNNFDLLLVYLGIMITSINFNNTTK